MTYEDVNAIRVRPGFRFSGRRAGDIAEVVDVVRGGIRPWSPTKEWPEFSGSVGHQMVQEETEDRRYAAPWTGGA